MKMVSVSIYIYIFEAMKIFVKLVVREGFEPSKA